MKMSVKKKRAVAIMTNVGIAGRKQRSFAKASSRLLGVMQHIIYNNCAPKQTDHPSKFTEYPAPIITHPPRCLHSATTSG